MTASALELAGQAWSIEDAAARVAAVAKRHADQVDRDGAFPAAAIAALKTEGLLGALVPVAFGGLGETLSAVAEACCTLAQACASTAMIYAMHQIQVACLVRHGTGSTWHCNFLRRIAAQRLLLASVTSEEGVGGNMRSSACAVQLGTGSHGAGQRGAGGYTLEKRGSAVSYGEHADALLITARSGAYAKPSDQVLVVSPREDCELERTGTWNALGMRGTCSSALRVVAAGKAEQILPAPFGQIASDTMVPVSHLLWASVWIGIAADAVDRARLFLRAAVRRSEGALPPGALRLSMAVELLEMLQARVTVGLRRFEAARACAAEPIPVGEAADMNTLKAGVSEACLQVVHQALLICGFAGYQNEGPYSLSRHLRDLNSAPLMINNDRIRETTARLLLASKPRLGLL
ncbi:MAG: acyl-CoA/acyl-ACP dehydrogenase [Acidisphaera sp.]|nr:acyl-CoA/acyl-ACP dehydrogenase [Acidisphaera sp.]